MSPQTNVLYEFGGFVLNPSARTLIHFNQPVELFGRDFDLLLHLVENSNILIKIDDLIDGVWGTDRAIHKRNISNHIAKIRKVLGCDARSPKFIKTVREKNSYRFIAKVELKEGDQAQADAEIPESSSGSAQRLEIETHVFVPMLFRPSLFDKIRVHEKQNRWIKYKEFQIEDGRLCLLPSGVGVWHLNSDRGFSSLTDVAVWRQQLYDEIFHNTHRLRKQSDELLKSFASTQPSILDSEVGKPGYAYSAFILKGPIWKNPAKRGRVLQLLSCPKPLEPKNASTSELMRSQILERHLLELGLTSQDMREFGLGGEEAGYASWEGLSYCSSSERTNETVSNIVEFQIAVHSLWWFSKCLSDAWLKDPMAATEELSRYLPDLKRQYVIVKNIEAKETTSQRTMIEAVLDTNRVRQIVDSALEIYR